ncbi:MAG TPA: DNA polymerase Y family protein [Acidimicrobiales bacterium]|nr:DNA polymerase Y family protein [Acidimicrobiales bacterium]
MTGAVRTLVVWCPDWPVVAAGLPLDVPVIVVRASRVVACSPAARAEGVALHQRRREAQGRCPELIVVDHDPAVDARTFEPVAATLEALTPRIEITHPGCCAFPTRGPSRYHGGDRALAGRAARLVGDVLAGRGVARIGVADGPFAARLAARIPAPDEAAGPPDLAPMRGSVGNRRDSSLERDAPGRVGPSPAPGAMGATGVMGGTSAPEAMGATAVGGTSAPGAVGATRAMGTLRVIEPGGSRAFLAERSVRALDRPELVDVLERLGIRTLGQLAALPVADVVGRFGVEGQVAHRLACGYDERPPATEPPPPDLSMAAEIDPPAERVEAAAFIARGLADDVAAGLAARGSACTRLVIGAETEHGERHERVWRTEGTFTTTAIADRVRWQVDGWLHAGINRPTGGLIRLWLAPDEIVPAGGRQLAFAAAGPGAVDAVEAAERAARALARVQGLAGIESAHVVEWRGGRGPGERVRLVPAAAVDVTEPRPAAQLGWVTEPWPGHVPDPAPATVHDPPLAAEVLDDAGRPVGVDGRGQASAAPATVVIAGLAGGPAVGLPGPAAGGAVVGSADPATGGAVAGLADPAASGQAGVSTAPAVGRADGRPLGRAGGGSSGGLPRGGSSGRLARGGSLGGLARGGSSGGPSGGGSSGGPPEGSAGRTAGGPVDRSVGGAAVRGRAVVDWAGPWPCDERWWDPDGRRRRVRIQVVLADGDAHLLTLEAGRWSVEATYD